MEQVHVTCEWRSTHLFEFDNPEDAEEFRGRVRGGGSDGLDALTEEGDVTAQLAEIIDWDCD